MKTDEADKIIAILRKLGFRPRQRTNTREAVDRYYRQVREWFMDRGNDVLRGRGAQKWHEMIWKESVLIALREGRLDVAEEVADAWPLGVEE